LKLRFLLLGKKFRRAQRRRIKIEDNWRQEKWWGFSEARGSNLNRDQTWSNLKAQLMCEGGRGRAVVFYFCRSSRKWSLRKKKEKSSKKGEKRKRRNGHRQARSKHRLVKNDFELAQSQSGIKVQHLGKGRNLGERDVAGSYLLTGEIGDFPHKKVSALCPKHSPIPKREARKNLRRKRKKKFWGKKLRRWSACNGASQLSP